MTLTADYTPIQYAGDGATISFPVTFVFWDADDLKLILSVDATGVETEWTRGTQYTVSGGNGSTGTVTVLTTPTDYTPASGETLTIKSNLANTQDTDLPAGGAFNSDAVEQQIDKIVRMLQQRSEELGRALKLTESSAYSGLTFPDPASGKILRYKADLSGFEAITFGEFAEAGGSVVPVPIGISDGGTGTTTAAAARTALGVPGLISDNAFSGANTFSGINTFTKAIVGNKGADIASATTLVLGTDGNSFDITGTTTITAITVSAGTWFTLQFDGALTFTHHATNLILPGGANITTAAGDVAICYAHAANQVTVASYQPALLPPTRPLHLTPVATTSGTSVALSTTIPAWAKKITVTFNGVSASGTSQWILQIGDSGGLETTGYLANASILTTSVVTSSFANGFPVLGQSAATYLVYGSVQLTLHDASTNTWVNSGVLINTAAPTIATHPSGGLKALSGTLDRISLTTAGGSDTFDAGAVSLMIE